MHTAKHIWRLQKNTQCCWIQIPCWCVAFKLEKVSRFNVWQLNKDSSLSHLTGTYRRKDVSLFSFSVMGGVMSRCELRGIMCALFRNRDSGTCRLRLLLWSTYSSDTKWHCRRSNISPYCIFWGWHVPPHHFEVVIFPEDCYVTPSVLTLIYLSVLALLNQLRQLNMMKNTRLGSCWRSSLLRFVPPFVSAGRFSGSIPSLMIVKTLFSYASLSQPSIQLPLCYMHIAKQLSFGVINHVYNCLELDDLRRNRYKIGETFPCIQT